MNPAHAIDDRAGSATGRSPQGRALPSGTRLREYELAEVIGEAGFAILYRAWDAALQRKVAVKEYLPVSMATRASDSPEVTISSERHWDAYKAGLKASFRSICSPGSDHPRWQGLRLWEENAQTKWYAALRGPGRRGALAESTTCRRRGTPRC